MKQGTVKWFNDAKGFGFVVGPDKELFVHYSQIEMEGRRTLLAGQQVEFNEGIGPTGKTQAENVRVIGAA